MQRFKNGNLRNDTIVVGLIGGAAGALVMELFNLILGKNLYFGKIAASMLVNPTRNSRQKNILLGEFIHLINGAWVGAIFSTMLKKTGNDFIYIKGLFAGLMTWMGLHNVGRRMDFFTVSPHSTKNHYLTLLLHLIFGATTTAVINRVAAPSLYEQPNPMPGPAEAESGPDTTIAPLSN